MEHENHKSGIGFVISKIEYPSFFVRSSLWSIFQFVFVYQRGKVLNIMGILCVGKREKYKRILFHRWKISTVITLHLLSVIKMEILFRWIYPHAPWHLLNKIIIFTGITNILFVFSRWMFNIIVQFLSQFHC